MAMFGFTNSISMEQYFSSFECRNVLSRELYFNELNIQELEYIDYCSKVKSL